MKKAEISTSMLVTIGVALAVFLVVSIWAYPKIVQITNNINETIPRNVFNIKESSFEKIEQSFNAPMMKFYEALQYEIPDKTPINAYKGVPVCVQELLPFGDFFKYYDLNLFISEEGETDVAYFRISDFEDNKIASKFFPTKKNFCVIQHEDHRTSPHAIVSEDKIMVPEELTITKNVKSLRKDSYTITIPGSGFSYDFDAGKFESMPLIYLEEDYACLVVGDNIKQDYTQKLPPCKVYSLEEVKEQIEHDIDTCLGIDQAGCGCSLTILEHEGLQIAINNYDGYSEITFKNNSKEISPLKINNYLFDLGGMLHKFDTYTKPASRGYDDTDGARLVGKLNYFSKNIYLGAKDDGFLIRNDFSGELSDFKEEIEIKDNKIVILKTKVPGTYTEEQIITSDKKVEVSQIKDKWNYFDIQNNINNAIWCK